MKHLLPVLISALFLSSCYSAQFTGTWFLDWQSLGDSLHETLPNALIISEDSDGCNITYSNTYYQQDWDSTDSDFSLTEEPASGTFALVVRPDPPAEKGDSIVLIDITNHQEVTYNITTDVIQASLTLKSPIGSSITFDALYTRNGAYRSQVSVFGALTGNWTANFSDEMRFTYEGGISCAPESIYLMPIADSAALKSTLYYATHACSIIKQNTATLKVASASTGPISFSGDESFIVFDPDQPDQIQTGGLTYKKAPATTDNLISGTWQLDWQSSNLFDGPASLQVSIVGSYMEAVMTFNKNDSYTSVFTEVDGYYLLAAHDLVFTYDTETNSLISNTDPEDIIFSPNGSLFNSEDFISNWVVDTTSVQGSCCVPEDIRITAGNTTSMLNAYYYFPIGMSHDANCASLQLEGPILETSLSIFAPSTTELTWTDSYGTRISFDNSFNTVEIDVEYFMNEGCGFKLKAGSA